MIKNHVVDDSVTVTIETRATGKVRMGMLHPVIDLQRCEMTPEVALSIAQSLLQAGHAAAMVQLRAHDMGAQSLAGAASLARQRGRINWLVLAVWSATACLWASIAAVYFTQ